jgi:hypothetical protein
MLGVAERGFLSVWIVTSVVSSKPLLAREQVS